tara:strand:- start:3 stop:596 length:594 start_codon:yes stop_codon:yes gene_type:complete
MADKVGGVKQFKPKKKSLKSLAALAGGTYGYNETPSITGTVFGKENESILGDIGLEVGAIKAAEKMLKGTGKKIMSRLALGSVPGIGTAAAGGLLLGDAASIGKELYSMTPKERKNFLEAIKSLPAAGKNLFKQNRKKTQTRLQREKNRSKALFNPTKKELLKRSKRVVRKKGGKVGRPKGVGCATKGFGKAMKRGK